MISNELLNTTFQNFKGPLVHGFQQNIPIRVAVMKRGQVSSDSGSYVERGLMSGSPARGVGVFNGDEGYDRTRYQKVKKYRVDFHRIVAQINIPQKELNQNKGKTGALKLVDEYPRAVIEGSALDFEKYLLTGKSMGMVFDSAELYGFATLNGQFSSGVGTGVENGWLDFLAVASQTDTVQNIAKSAAIYHYNQFGQITAWATDGVEVLRKTYRSCAQFAGKPGGGPDLVVMDDDTFGNYQRSKADVVRLVRVQDNPDKDNLTADVLGKGIVYPSQLIDIASDFTGVAALGVTYMVNTEFIEIVQLEKWDVSDFKELQDQDGVAAKFAGHEAWICRKFPAQGCVAGGSR